MQLKCISHILSFLLILTKIILYYIFVFKHIDFYMKLKKLYKKINFIWSLLIIIIKYLKIWEDISLSDILINKNLNFMI